MNSSSTQSTPKLVAYVDTLAVYHPPQTVVDNILMNIGKFNYLILAFWETTKPGDVALSGAMEKLSLLMLSISFIRLV